MLINDIARKILSDKSEITANARVRVGHSILGNMWGIVLVTMMQVRRHVVHDPLETKPLKGATKPIGELAISVKIERLAGNRGALHDFAFNGEHGAAARDLFLAFAQPVDAAKVSRDARQNVTESTRDFEPRVAVNEQLAAIGHLAAPFRRERDHLAGELPAPNCSHDKSALPGYP